jgi:hypothetical protein
MKKNVILLLIAISFLSSCIGDKYLRAKTTISFVSIGVDTAKSVIDQMVTIKTQECLSKACKNEQCTENDQVVFDQCFSQTKKMIEATDILFPQLKLALKVSAEAVKVAEKGGEASFTPLIRNSVCLLTKLLNWVPDKYRSKIQLWLDLATQYSCNQSSCNPTWKQQLELAKEFNRLIPQLIS